MASAAEHKLQITRMRTLSLAHLQVLAPQSHPAAQPAAGVSGKAGSRAAPESGVVAVVDAEAAHKGRKKSAKTRRGKKGGAAAAAAAAADAAAEAPEAGAGPAAAAVLTGASVARLLQSERGLAAAQDVGIGRATGGPFVVSAKPVSQQVIGPGYCCMTFPDSGTVLVMC
jgi:hypothetical protein